MANYTFKPTFLGQDKEEDLVPETPTDAIGRYAVLLLHWEELTRRQAKYDDDLRKLHAAGDALQAEWDTLAVERQWCLSALEALDTPRHQIIERAWDLFKAHLGLLCQTARRGSNAFSGSVPTPITTLADALPRDPRIT
jgi:hypothetical protein